MTDMSRGVVPAPAFFAPFVAETLHRLREERWNEIDPSGETLDQDSIRRAVAGTLLADLRRIAGRTLAEEAAAKGEPIESFARDVAAPAGRDALLARYPLLALRIAQAGERAAATAAQTVRRFAADRAQIIEALLDGADPGRLTAIEPTTGDPHQGGRRVAFLRFAGLTEPLVYKPRPLTSATLYAKLIGWLNARLPGLAMACMPTLVQDGYGWAGYVRHEPCRTAEQVQRFYYRQGALLALLYAVNGTDAHADNLIAQGDQPILIDTETLLHPVLAQSTLVGADPALAALERSVYRTALLPTLVHAEHGATDISGIGGRGTEAGNRVTLQRRPVEPGDHLPDLLRGFGDTYTTISRDAEAFSALLTVGEDVVTRLVPRATRLYAELIEDCLAPELLRHPDRIDAAIDQALSTQQFERTGRLKEYEHCDLENLDIPIFFVRGGSRAVWSSGGDRLADVLEISGVDAARAKVRAMDETDRRRQEWFISAAFATATGPLDHRCAAPVPVPVAVPGAVPVAGPVSGAVPVRKPGSSPVSPPSSSLDSSLVSPLASPPSSSLTSWPASSPSSPLDPEWALDQAFAVAHRLDRLGYREAGRRRINWLSLEPLEDGHLAILPAGAGLPHGYTGVALFLAQLGAVSGRAEYLDRAHEAISPLPHLLAELSHRPAHLAAIGPGFAGLDGIAYALTRLAALLSAPELARCAKETNSLAAAFAADDPGTEPTPPVDPADPDDLADLAGLADSGSVAPAPPADPADPDDLTDSGDGWCRGIAGRAAAGAIAPAMLDLWLTRLAATPPLSDLSLCHGELGILEALTILAARRDETARARAEAHAVLDHRRALLPQAVRHGARFNGTPGGVPTPGIMHGLAGVGYGLLRMGFTQRVPSVLMMEC